METLHQCPLCGHPGSTIALSAVDHTVSKESFSIQACSGCGFRFTSPRPAPEHIGAYYLSKDYISHAAKASGLRDQLYHGVRKRAIQGKHRLIARTHPAGRVLDVGCGTGDFLHFLQTKGYAVQGVEVSPQACAIAQGKGLAVQERLEALPAGSQFEVITLWHVLEHVPDPRQTLAQLHAMATKDALLVIAVPNHACWDAAHYGPYWAAWDVPRHLSHFRQPDMERALDGAGFALRSTRNMWFDAPYVAMLSEQYRGAGTVGSLLKGALVGLWSNGVAWATGRPTSSTLYLAEKR